MVFVCIGMSDNMQKLWKPVYFSDGNAAVYIVETVKGRQIGEVDYRTLDEAKKKALSYTNRTKHDALIYKSVGYTTPRKR